MNSEQHDIQGQVEEVSSQTGEGGGSRRTRGWGRGDLTRAWDGAWSLEPGAWILELGRCLWNETRTGRTLL